MSNFFNMDNVVWRTLGKLADLMILNIVFLICCIPIFTIGASLTSLSYVTLKMHDGEEGYITRSFFKSFRQNFKQATAIWLILLAVGAVLVFDMLILRNTGGSVSSVMTVVIMAIIVVYLMVFLYVFPILSRFVNSVKTTIVNAFIMAIADFPRTALMIIITVAAVLVTFLNAYTLMWGILIWILAGFALLSYVNNYFMSRILKKYMPADEEETKDPDEWDVDETMADEKPAQEAAKELEEKEDHA